VVEIERIGRARAVERDLAEHAAHALFHLGQERAFGQRQHAGGILFRHGPHQRAAVRAIRLVQQGSSAKGPAG
jgi:hypothetical protein